MKQEKTVKGCSFSHWLLKLSLLPKTFGNWINKFQFLIPPPLPHTLTTSHWKLHPWFSYAKERNNESSKLGQLWFWPTKGIWLLFYLDIWVQKWTPYLDNIKPVRFWQSDRKSYILFSFPVWGFYLICKSGVKTKLSLASSLC